MGSCYNLSVLPPPEGSHGPPGTQGDPGQLATTDTTWKAADIGFFDPPRKFPDGTDIIKNITYYSDVYVFIDRMNNLVLLKLEEVARANIHSCLKGDALRWYSYELTSDEKRLMNQVSLEHAGTAEAGDNWFDCTELSNRFKTWWISLFVVKIGILAIHEIGVELLNPTFLTEAPHILGHINLLAW